MLPLLILAAMPVLRLISGSKIGFSLRRGGGTRCRDKREIWHRGADASPCQISCLSAQKRGNIAPKLSKFGILRTDLVGGLA